MADLVKTFQSNIKTNTRDMTKYSLFLGGLNVTAKALAQYDPFRGGRSRLFFVRMPKFMEAILPEKTKNFRHLLEYGFTRVDGIGNTSMDYDPMTGGYAGRSFDIPTLSKDETSSISITLYEFAGSPVREYLDMWISGIADPNTGLGTYHGAREIDPTIKYAQVNHVAECFYVVTDPTGDKEGVEYCCLFANMMPRGVPKDHLNYDSGSSPVATINVEFTTTKYESPQINEIGKLLIDKNKILRDYLNFDSQYTADDIKNLPSPDIAV